ncbi:MAG: protease HtpX [Kiritimatiellia bacterium]
MLRIILFILTNLAIMLVAGLVTALLGLDSQTSVGLAAIALVWGMLGAFISLLLSKFIATRSVGAIQIKPHQSPEGDWLLNTIEGLSRSAGIQMPEVALYHGEPNAFATGAFRNSALVAVSDGLLQRLDKREIRAVLGHEIAHVANGDMVTMTLLQGILNAAVIFLSRAIGRIVASAGDGRRFNTGIYFLVRFILELALGLVAAIIVMAYSRRREFAADAGSVQLTGSAGDMIAALKALSGGEEGEPLPDTVKAFGIRSRPSFAALFASHPPMAARIAALEKLCGGRY